MMPISSGSVFSLSERKIDDYCKKSTNGDNEAAFRLYQYYTFSMYDKNLSLKWLQEAAKLGNVIAQYNLAIYYEEIDDSVNAKIWGVKAYEGGNEKAKRFIKK